MIATEKKSENLNGMNLPVLRKLLNDVKHDATRGTTHWGVTTRWMGGAVSETEVTGFEIAGKRVKRSFKFRTDEPNELAGCDTPGQPHSHPVSSLSR
ncbi:hypothetical protein BH09PLA1_BH09PLA1_31650 [soil metagenome]